MIVLRTVVDDPLAMAFLVSLPSSLSLSRNSPSWIPVSMMSSIRGIWYQAPPRSAAGSA